MKLSTFDKVNTEIKTEYTVFMGDKYIDSFTVDYLGEKSNNDKKLKLINMGAKVRYVSIHTHSHNLSVTVEI